MIRLGGTAPLTSIDFPGRLAAVLFLQGCPWHCGYCHNPHLIPARAAPPTADWEEAVAFLSRRRGLLDGVVFSGGEPTAQAALPRAIDRVREMGFEVALHTGGMYPERLRGSLCRVEWVGLDIKAPDDRYDQVTRSRGAARRVRQSLDHLLASGVAYECRTTWDPTIFPEEDLHRLAVDLAARGVRHWVVQEHRPLHGPRVRCGDWTGIEALAPLFETFGIRRG